MAYKFQEGLAKLDGLISGSSVIVAKTSFSGSGDVAVTGAVHAAQFYGGGAGITGVTAGAAGSDTQVQFNDGGSTLAGDTGLVFNKTSNALTVAGILKTDSTTDATSKTDGSLQTDGGLSVAKAIYNGTAATLAADSGVVTMGAATALTVSAAGLLNVNNATEATSATDGSLQTDGGLSVVKSAVIGDDLDLLSNGAILNIGSDEKWTATHANSNDTLTVSSGHRLAFGAVGEYVSGDGTNLLLVSGDDVKVTGDLVPSADDTYDLGTTALAWQDLHLEGDIKATDALTIDTAAGAIHLDSAGAVELDSNTGDVAFLAAGVDQLALDMDGTGGEIIMQLKVDSDDFVFKQYDGTEVFRVEDDGAFDIAGGFGSTGVTVSAAGAISVDGISTLGATTGATVSAAGLVNVNNATEATSATDGSLQTDGGLSVVKSAVIGDDLDLLSNAAVFKVGSDQPFTLTHANASNTLLATANHRLAFGDAGDYITGDGTDISIVGSNEINLAATTIDINGAIHVDSTMGIAADADLLTFANAKLTVAGDLLASEGTVSGASTLQAVGNTTLGGQLAVTGGLQFHIETVTAATELTASNAHMYNLVSGGTANITVRLPSASAGEDYQYVIKRHALMSGNVVISSSGIDKDPAKQFDGENSITLESPGASVFLISDGAMWNIF